MIRAAAIIFDFDGVLIESEYLSNRQIAAFLTDAGYPTTVEESMQRFMGLSGDAFTTAVEDWVGGPVPKGFAAARDAEDRRVMIDGIDAVNGAVQFVRNLPPSLPKAIASSSSTAWIVRHLTHIGLRDAFAGHVYSGREHVTRGKPAPDLYVFAAHQLGVPIPDCVVIEDSVIGVTGAVASGAKVVGFCGGRHCGPGHGSRLRAAGVGLIARSFAEIAEIVAY